MDESDAAGSPGGRPASDNPHVSVVLPDRKYIVDSVSGSLETGFRPAGLPSGSQGASSDSVHAHRARTHQLYAYSPERRSAVGLDEMGSVVSGVPGFGHGSGRSRAMAVSHCAHLARRPSAAA